MPTKLNFKYAGQEFWEFLSGDENLFREIIKPIDDEARQKDEAFRNAYRAKINELTADFSLNFLRDGEIDWLKLVDFVSVREPVMLQTAKGVTTQAEKSVRKAKKAARQWSSEVQLIKRRTLRFGRQAYTDEY